MCEGELLLEDLDGVLLEEVCEEAMLRIGDERRRDASGADAMLEEFILELKELCGRSDVVLDCGLGEGRVVENGDKLFCLVSSED